MSRKSLLVSLVAAIFLPTCGYAEVFYQICEREKTCLDGQSCQPQSGRRMFRIDTVRRSTFDYGSGITAYWDNLDSWYSATKSVFGFNVHKVTLHDWDQKNRIMRWQEHIIYVPPNVGTSMEIKFGDAYDWTSSFEKEKPHKFRYSYSLKIDEHVVGQQYDGSNLEYGYCNMQAGSDSRSR